MRFLIKGLKVYSEQKVIKNGAVLVENGLIAEIFTNEQQQRFCEKITYQFSANSHLIPGFIDLHIHGLKNYDVMDATNNALDNICQELPQEGTTAYLATTMTASNQMIENSLINLANYHKKTSQGAEILGIHLEGPFISPEKRGAHDIKYIQKPNLSLFQKWYELSNNLIKLVTIAPELANSLELIEFLKKHTIIAAIGHSNASFENTIQAIEKNCTYATHLFNAMHPIHQRNPGCALAALLHPDVFCEIIADHIHIHPAMIHLAQRLKGYERLILSTDSMRAKGMPDGEYELGGKKVTVKSNIAQLSNKTLAGSTLKMIDAFKNIKTNLHCTIENLISLCSSNPAKVLNIYDRKGSIEKGKDADLVVLDEKYDVIFTICKGQIAYQKTNEKK